MDFDLTGDHQVVAELAGQIFADHAQESRIREVEDSLGGHDPVLWQALAEADLLGISLPEDVGGSGLNMLGLFALLEQQGRRVAPAPLWAVLTLAAQPIAEHGTDQQRKRWLPGLIDGSVIVTGAFDTDPGQGCPVPATKDGEALVVVGELTGVTAAPIAQAVLVPVQTPSGLVIAIIPTDRPGVRVSIEPVTSRESSGTVILDAVRVEPADLLPTAGAEVIESIRARAQIALAALAAGVCAEAVAMCAQYTSQRTQFDRPLSANQGVSLRAADAQLDTERIRLTALKAAWLADQGDEKQARYAALAAKWWACVGGLRVVHSTQHLHGGIGADVDYPIHRHFLWGRQIAFTMGSAGALQAELGRLLTEVPPVGTSF